MYCPRCSQKQASDDPRFCSRCGFQMAVVKELLAEGDHAPVATTLSNPRTKFFSRRKQDLLFGATFLYVAAVITVAVSWVHPKGAIIVPLGLVWLNFSLFVLFFDELMRVLRKLFSDDAEPAQLNPSLQNASSFVGGVMPSTSVLPPIQGIPVAALGAQRATTSEIVRPSSITEHTTELLNKK